MRVYSSANINKQIATNAWHPDMYTRNLCVYYTLTFTYVHIYARTHSLRYCAMHSMDTCIESMP